MREYEPLYGSQDQARIRHTKRALCATGSSSARFDDHRDTSLSEPYGLGLDWPAPGVPFFMSHLCHGHPELSSDRLQWLRDLFRIPSFGRRMTAARNVFHPILVNEAFADRTAREGWELMGLIGFFRKRRKDALPMTWEDATRAVRGNPLFENQARDCSV